MVFIFLLAVTHSMQNLSSQTRGQTCPPPPHLQCRILTIGPPGKSLYDYLKSKTSQKIKDIVFFFFLTFKNKSFMF